jgi:translocation and assembly module TamB
MDIPIKADAGLASVKVDTTVNEGKLLMPLQVDATKAVMVASMPPNTQFLNQVKITDDLADQFISRASPIFKGAVVSGGRVSLLSRALSVPLGPDLKQKAAFDGELGLNSVALRPGGMLAQLFSVIKAGNAQLVTLPDQRVAVVLKDGRIQQGPLTVQFGPYAMRISGSVGLVDMSLDMLAEVPVTPELVGGKSDLYQALKGETLRIPIKGTAKEPSIGSDVLQANLNTLIKGAAKNLIEQKGGELLKQGLDSLLKRK